jgi:8-oxo-dGTP pyrophosphatase MutT (NUDIX family)
MTARAPGTPRIAARVMLLDSDQRVLLMHERRDIGSDRTHWITPGGGVEPGETLAEGAMRELYEETGLRLQIAADAEPVFTDSVDFSIAGGRYLQTNHYFLLRCASGLDIVPAGHTEVERLVVLGHRWWSLDELTASSVDREPVAIVDILRSELSGEAAS